MKQIVVLSGKGGTGKTTVVAALAVRAAVDHRLVLVDADVDAANLGLLLDPEVVETHTFPDGGRAVIDADACIVCATCMDACRFDAIRLGRDGGMLVDRIRCEGCGACVDTCPSEAVRLEVGTGGVWWASETRYGRLFHAELEPGEENSGRLVTVVRNAAREHAERADADLVLADGPPGIGCPAIAACAGVDLAVVVAEPSLYGAHDLERALDLLRHFRIPARVCVNRADLSPGRTAALHEMMRARDLEEPIDIPFDDEVIRAVRSGQPLGTDLGGPAAAALSRLWEDLAGRGARLAVR